MKKAIITATIFFSLFSCNRDKRVIERIDFTTNYKFTSEIEDRVSRDTTPWKYQFSAADFASKGDYRNALIHWDLAIGGSEKTYSQYQIDSINSLFKKIPAKEYIIKRAKDERIIIINEAHHSSLHRFFTKSLLKELFDLGYKNLGLEALGNGQYLDTLLMKRGYPNQETGWYILEPQFGNMVREAIEIGFDVFPYEQTSGVNGKEREIEQAKSIQEELEKKPNEKFIIHCGFAHSLEGEYPRWGKAMAGRLKEFTGIDPLTINQVAYSEKGDPKLNNPFLNAINPKQSIILVDSSDVPLRYTREDSWSDIAIFHPTTNYLNNRPDWIFSGGNLKTKIDLSEIKFTYPALIMAFKEGEEINKAVPVDIVELSQKTDSCVLALRKGNYTIVLTNKLESLKFNKTMK